MLPVSPPSRDLMSLHPHYRCCRWLKNRRVKTNQWSDVVMAEEEGIRFLMVDLVTDVYSAVERGIMLGSLTEDGEVGCNQFQSVVFLTDGFATTPTMRKLNLIWVTSRMHIEIYRYPACEGRIATRRDWILKDIANGEFTGRATRFPSHHCLLSPLVMMNQDTRRLQKVSDDVRDEHLMFCPKEPRLAYPEEENTRSLKNIPKLEDLAKYSIIGLKPRRADLGMNHHVNNVTYIGWLLETRILARRCGGFIDHLKEWLCNIRHTKPQQYPVLTSPKVVG
ncbi:hypothetical protein Bca101_099502 [Brassica carinata]